MGNLQNQENQERRTSLDKAKSINSDTYSESPAFCRSRDMDIDKASEVGRGQQGSAEGSFKSFGKEKENNDDIDNKEMTEVSI